MATTIRTPNMRRDGSRRPRLDGERRVNGGDLWTRTRRSQALEIPEVEESKEELDVPQVVDMVTDSDLELILQGGGVGNTNLDGLITHSGCCPFMHTLREWVYGRTIWFRKRFFPREYAARQALHAIEDEYYRVEQEQRLSLKDAVRLYQLSEKKRFEASMQARRKWLRDTLAESGERHLMGMADYNVVPVMGQRDYDPLTPAQRSLVDSFDLEMEEMDGALTDIEVRHLVEWNSGEERYVNSSVADDFPDGARAMMVFEATIERRRAIRRSEMVVENRLLVTGFTMEQLVSFWSISRNGAYSHLVVRNPSGPTDLGIVRRREVYLKHLQIERRGPVIEVASSEDVAPPLQIPKRFISIPLLVAMVDDARARFGTTKNDAANRLVVTHHMLKRLKKLEMHQSTVGDHVDLAVSLYCRPRPATIMAGLLGAYTGFEGPSNFTPWGFHST